jgi:heme A synthase
VLPRIHGEFGLGVAFVFLIIALLGLVFWIRNRDPGATFWRLVALAQVGVGVQILLGTLMLLSGRRATNWVHYAYGLFPVLTLYVAHRYSKKAKGLEWVAFAIVGLVNFGLMFRGYMTGMGHP